MAQDLPVSPVKFTISRDLRLVQTNVSVGDVGSVSGRTFVDDRYGVGAILFLRRQSAKNQTFICADATGGCGREPAFGDHPPMVHSWLRCSMALNFFSTLIFKDTKYERSLPLVTTKTAYPSIPTKSSALKCVYRFSICKVLCPVMAA